ncbi:hypothetical protein ACIQPP_49480 [Streptomyces violaceusniger]|uniref:hypothetical protein n=1 Tax=Streptomyces violaceusniger TaxID=68280 RepID=UPI0009C2A401|nr:hypothetical protein [Streptomyces hygroscopicus]AQW56547.1 thiamine biosynthesis protein ThiF [Streptomyces hygroscopicus]
MLILIPHRAAETLRGAGPWGRLTLRIDRPEGRAVVAGISQRENSIIPVDPDLRSRLLGSCDSAPTGYWYRASAELHAIWIELRKRRNAATALDTFKTGVAGGFKTPGTEGYLALTYAPGMQDAFPEHHLPDLLAWHITPARAAPPLPCPSSPPPPGSTSSTATGPPNTCSRHGLC